MKGYMWSDLLWSEWYMSLVCSWLLFIIVEWWFISGWRLIDDSLFMKRCLIWEIIVIDMIVVVLGCWVSNIDFWLIANN